MNLLSNFMRRPGPVCAVAWLAGLAIAQAQPQTNPPATVLLSNNPPRSLSLAEVTRTAFERNWDLLAAASGIDLATAQLLVAKEFPNPTASLTTSKIGSREAATPLGNGLWERSYDSIAAVSQLIEIAGKRHHRQTAARAGILGAKARFYDAKRILDQGVTKAYIAALLAADNARIQTESAGYMRHEASIAEERFRAGDLAESDMKTLQINAEQLEYQATVAEAAAHQARVAVEVLMAERRPNGNWKPGESLESLMEIASTPPPIEARTGATRTDVLAAEADLRAGQAQLGLQKALRIPDPTFSLGGEHNPPGGGPPVDTFNFGISFPLPLWNHNRGNIMAAQASVDQSAFALGKVQTQVKADIAVAEFAYNEAHARWLRYRDETAPKSAQVRDSMAFKYERGAATLVDLLNAEQTDNTIRLALAQAMNDTANAVADVRAARLTLTETDLNPRKQ